MRPERKAMEVLPRQPRLNGRAGHACRGDARKASYEAVQGWECSCGPERASFLDEGFSAFRSGCAGQNGNETSPVANTGLYGHNKSSADPFLEHSAFAEREWRHLMRGSSRRSMASMDVEDDLGGTSYPGDARTLLDGRHLHLPWAECAESTCSVELICTDLLGWAIYNQTKAKNLRPHLPPPNYDPAKSRSNLFHCEIEIRNCDDTLLRVGVIGPGPDSVPGPVLGRNGQEVVPGSVIQQRTPTLKERDASGKFAHPWERSLGIWEFECGQGCLYGGPCDIDLALPKYPYNFDKWSESRNCNTFASWYLHFRGIEFEDWPEQIRGLCPEISPWRSSR